MLLLGFGGGDMHHDVYLDVDTPSGSEASFKIFSLQALTAFVMMFGWAGLASLVQFGLNPGLSVIVASGVGAGSMYFTSSIMRMLLKLQDEGASYTMEMAVGKNASVYERIPESGIGRIQLHIGGMLREFQAVSEKKITLEPSTPVTVVRIVDTQTVSVAAIQ